MAESNSLKIIDVSNISPPPGSVPTTCLPLTYFDIPWLLCRPMQRLFFYEFPDSTLHFTQNVLPNLKRSLSLALQHFFPLAGNLMIYKPESPHKPYIRFADSDSVNFIVAESTSDFNQVIADHVKDVRILHPFVPKLLPASVLSDGTLATPLFAVQVTLFPNSGVCIGGQFRHVVTDGMAFNHFIKSWASIFRSIAADSAEFEDELVLAPPCHDRELVKDPQELESIFLKEWWSWASSWDYDMGSTQEDLKDKVRATFVIYQAHSAKLKSWVSSQSKKQNIHQFRLSTFVVTCALTWVGWTKAMEVSSLDSFDNEDRLCHFSFVADCRQRLGLPTTYFGNCLSIPFMSAKKSELLGENGILVAAKTIGEKVKELESGVLVGAEKWMSNWRERSEEGELLAVAGSPKLRVYETDFGWGRPKKSEVVQIDASNVIYLSEGKDGGGGIEVGLALAKRQMDIFVANFEQFFKQI